MIAEKGVKFITEVVAMNKKNWSFVLAMVLSLCLGSLVYAVDTTFTDTGLTAVITENKSDDSITVKMTDNEKSLIGDIVSRISAIFNYKAGMLLSVMDKDRNVTLYDAGKARLTLSYTASGLGDGKGSFAVTNVNVDGTDLKAIQKVGGLAAYLKGFGMTDAQLSYTTDGEVADSDNQNTVAWLSRAASHLSKGINNSISIGVTSGKGASVTLATNGNALATYAYDDTLIKQYNYNASGFLESISEAAYKLENSTTTTATIPSGEVKYEKVWNTTKIDVYGRASSVVDYQGNTISTFQYAYNGSLVSVINATKEETTFYSAGKESYTMNASGAVVAKYEYHANGSLDGVTSTVYDEDGNLTETSISAYQWGKLVATADLSGTGGSRTFQEVRDTVETMRREATSATTPQWVVDLQNGTETRDEDGGRNNTSRYSNITSIAIYSSDLNNTNFLKGLGFKDEDITRLALTNNGTSSLATATLTFGSIPFGTTVTNKEKTTTKGSGDAKGTVLGTETSDETTTEGKDGTNLTIALMINDRGAQSYSIEKACEYTIKAAVNKKVTRTTTTTVSSDPVIEGNLSEQTAAELGLEEGSVENGFYTDPETGKIYAIVEAKSINIMDGEGAHELQPAEGEVIFVEVSESVKNEVVNRENSADRSIMFMGDVRESVTNAEGKSYLAITMNSSYSSGFALGEENVNAIKEEISAISQAVAAVKSGTGTNAQKELVNNAEANGYGWVVNNTEENIATFATGKFSFDKDKTTRENLEAAWTLLLQF